MGYFPCFSLLEPDSLELALVLLEGFRHLLVLISKNHQLFLFKLFDLFLEPPLDFYLFYFLDFEFLVLLGDLLFLFLVLLFKILFLFLYKLDLLVDLLVILVVFYVKAVVELLDLS